MCGASSDEAPKHGSSAWQRVVSRPVQGIRGYSRFTKSVDDGATISVHPRSLWEREQIEPAAHEGSRCSDAARRHVAIDLSARPDEDDAVTGRILVVPFDLVVRDDNLLS
jgi:hypothetical protein